MESSLYALEVDAPAEGAAATGAGPRSPRHAPPAPGWRRDVKTTITHPASTSHGRLSEEQRRAAGIGQGLLRISVGLEYLGDLKNDLSRGLDTLQ